MFAGRLRQAAKAPFCGHRTTGEWPTKNGDRKDQEMTALGKTGKKKNEGQAMHMCDGKPVLAFFLIHSHPKNELAIVDYILTCLLVISRSNLQAGRSLVFYWVIAMRNPISLFTRTCVWQSYCQVQGIISWPIWEFLALAVPSFIRWCMYVMYCKAAQWKVMQYNWMQCNAMQGNVIRCDLMWCDVMLSHFMSYNVLSLHTYHVCI
jgi:hypothetical protein